MDPNQNQPEPEQPTQQPVEQAQPEQPEQTQQAAQPVAAANSGDQPGKTLGIVGLILAFVAPLIGLILSIVAKRQSSKAGQPNTPAVIGIVLGAIFTVLGLIVAGVMLAGIGAVVSQCAELGPGTHVKDGVTYTCGDVR